MIVLPRAAMAQPLELELGAVMRWAEAVLRCVSRFMTPLERFGRQVRPDKAVARSPYIETVAGFKL